MVAQVAPQFHLSLFRARVQPWVKILHTHTHTCMRRHTHTHDAVTQLNVVRAKPLVCHYVADGGLGGRGGAVTATLLQVVFFFHG